MRTFSYTVPPEDDGRLIKRVIRGRLGLSHRQFVLLKGEGGMLLDGVPVHANQVVKSGQVIEARLAEKDTAAPGRPGPLDIRYQDEDVLVINKQAPLACQASRRQAGDALENFLSYYFRELPAYTFRPVNRLDKGTSGLMAVAMNAHAQMTLSRALHGEGFVREYRALVAGAPPRPEGWVEAPIRKAEGATVRREVHPAGKRAATYYQTIESDGQVSLLRLVLETGRTHQIRVHMAHLGCPVLGDFLYGTEDARLPGRFALHSAFLRFDHPQSGQCLEFAAPLPIELARLCPGFPSQLPNSPK